MNEMDYSNWWAEVKYSSRYGSRKFDVVPVCKIQYEYISSKKKITKRKAIKPKTLKDFETTTWYVVWSSKDVPDGKEHPFYAIIGRMAEKEEDLLKADLPRVHWPTVEEHNDEPDTNVESSSGETTNPVLHQRQVRLTSKSAKQNAQKHSIEDYMSSTQLTPDAFNNDQYDIGESSDQEVGEGETVAELKAKIRRLEQASAASTSSREENIVEFVKEGFASLLSALNKIANSVSALKDETGSLKTNFINQENEIAKVQGAVTKMETLMNSDYGTGASGLNDEEEAATSPSPSTGTSYSGLSSLTRVDNKVEWLQGSNIYIRETCLRSMSTAKQFTDWINAFLDGVFDDDVIPKLRVRKRKGSDTTVIPPRIILAAKREFRSWLEKLGRYDELEIEEYVKNFGGMVGDVCIARNGPRGTMGKLRKAEAAGEDVTRELAAYKAQSAEREAQRAIKGTPRRPYARKGAKTLLTTNVSRPGPSRTSPGPSRTSSTLSSTVQAGNESREDNLIEMVDNELPTPISPVAPDEMMHPPEGGILQTL